MLGLFFFYTKDLEIAPPIHGAVSGTAARSETTGQARLGGFNFILPYFRLWLTSFQRMLFADQSSRGPSRLLTTFAPEICAVLTRITF